MTAATRTATVAAQRFVEAPVSVQIGPPLSPSRSTRPGRQGLRPCSATQGVESLPGSGHPNMVTVDVRKVHMGIGVAFPLSVGSLSCARFGFAMSPRLRGVLNRPLLVMVAVLMTGCTIPGPGFGDPDPPLTKGEMVGTWESETGASIELSKDETFVIRDLPEDVWDHGESPRKRLEIAGTWELCTASEDSLQLCDDGDGDDFLSMDLSWDSMTIDGVTTVEHGLQTNVAITGPANDRELWLAPYAMTFLTLAISSPRLTSAWFSADRVHRRAWRGSKLAPGRIRFAAGSVSCNEPAPALRFSATPRRQTSRIARVAVMSTVVLPSTGSRSARAPGTILPVGQPEHLGDSGRGRGQRLNRCHPDLGQQQFSMQNRGILERVEAMSSYEDLHGDDMLFKLARDSVALYLSRKKSLKRLIDDLCSVRENLTDSDTREEIDKSWEDLEERYAVAAGEGERSGKSAVEVMTQKDKDSIDKTIRSIEQLLKDLPFSRELLRHEQ